MYFLARKINTAKRWEGERICRLDHLVSVRKKESSKYGKEHYFMNKLVEQNCEILYLTIGKEVKVNFDEENYLASIRLSINKIAELFGNKVVNEESIFYVSTIGLVTKSNYKTYISVVGGKQVISGNANYEKVTVDQERTSKKTGNTKVFEQGYFEFFVSEEDKIPRNKLIVPRNIKKRR